MAERLTEGCTARSHNGPNSLVIEPVHRGDTSVVTWVAEPSDGPGVALSPQLAREIAHELITGADAIDPAGARHDTHSVTNIAPPGFSGVQAGTIHGGVWC